MATLLHHTDLAFEAGTPLWCHPSMSNRLKELRIIAGLSQTELAEKAGTTQQQVGRLERGERKLSADWLARLAPHLGVDPGEILSRNEGPVPADGRNGTIKISGGNNRDLPVFGMTQQGRNAFTFDGTRVVDRVPRPDLLRNAPMAYGLYHDGTDMEPRYYAGELLYVHPGRPVTDGCFVFAVLEDGEGVVARLAERNGETVTLETFSPAARRTIGTAEISRLHRIIGAAESP